MKGHGDINIKLTNSNEKIVSNILYIPILTKNLFFIRQLNKTRGEIFIRAGETTLKNKFSQTIAIRKLNSNLYESYTTILLIKPQIAIPTIIQFNKADL